MNIFDQLRINSKFLQNTIRDYHYWDNFSKKGVATKLGWKVNFKRFETDSLKFWEIR